MMRASKDSAGGAKAGSGDDSGGGSGMRRAASVGEGLGELAHRDLDGQSDLTAFFEGALPSPTIRHRHPHHHHKHHAHYQRHLQAEGGAGSAQGGAAAAAAASSVSGSGGGKKASSLAQEAARRLGLTTPYTSSGGIHADGSGGSVGSSVSASSSSSSSASSMMLMDDRSAAAAAACDSDDGRLGLPLFDDDDDDFGPCDGHYDESQDLKFSLTFELGSPSLRDLVGYAGGSSAASTISDWQAGQRKVLIKKAVRRAQAAARGGADELRRRRARIENTLQEPEFVRFSDKVTFCLSLGLLLALEWIALVRPQWLPSFYAGSITPLLIVRYVLYSRMKFQYFMLDFCYFAQVMLFAWLYVWPTPRLFAMTFALCTGPLACAVPMWRNSLVLHDLDKMTSSAIHLLPPIVVYVVRWFPQAVAHAGVCASGSGSVDGGDSCLTPNGWLVALFESLVAYGVWQAIYLVQTELIDGTRIRRDDLITSVRWMTEKRPHPIYRAIRRRGYNPNPVALLVGMQFLYTIIVILPVPLFFNFFYLHTAYVALIFLCATWNGANFYFESFTENYNARLQRSLKDAEKKVDGRQQKKKDQAVAAKGDDNCQEKESEDQTPESTGSSAAEAAAKGQ